MMITITYIEQLFSGVYLTLQLLFCSILLGLLLAIALTLMRLSAQRYLVGVAKVYIFVIRGTPLLIQFFLIYYGLSQFETIRNSIFWILLQKPFACAILALAINTSAYTSVLLKGAVDAIPKGEFEAARALGMSWFLMMRRIILPRAFRIALPAYSNEVVMVLKGTSLASTITIMELFGVTKQIIAETYADIQYMLLAGLIYFILNAVIMWGFRYAESSLAITASSNR